MEFGVCTTTPTGLPNGAEIGLLKGRWATPLGLWEG
jgi:hypothetical protein